MAHTKINTQVIPDGTIVSADLSMPITGFSSTGIDDNATSTAITIDSSENVGIGTTSPSTPLTVNGTTDGDIIEFRKDDTNVGSIYVASAGTTYNTTSDIRLKDNVAPIADAKEKLISMNPVMYTWISSPESPAVRGFIAQEMQKIIPEAVNGDPKSDKMMSMDYGRITPVIVAALQEAFKEIEQLKLKIEQLENNK